MQLFYNPNIQETDTSFVFEKEESKHIVKVLRKAKGDEIHLTNGLGGLFEAEITADDPKQCAVRILAHSITYPDRHHLHMAVAPTKNNDRFEWFLEKAVEIGVHEITPLICENSERRKIKPERLERVLQSAMKQSLQTFLPKLNAPISFEDFMALPQDGLTFIAHCAEGEKHELKRRVAADKDLCILIGPEGDFSPNEIKTAKNNGYAPVSLGKNRLRTETAAVVACATVAFINNG